MKKSFLTVSLLLLFTAIHAQVKNPVAWNFSAQQISKGQYEVRLSATLEKGWHIYSQTTPEGGPAPTQIQFTRNPLLQLSGEIRELGQLEQHHEPLFGVDVKQYSNKVEFVQVLQTKGRAKTNLSGKITYMLCNEQECLPPKTISFSILIK